MRWTTLLLSLLTAVCSLPARAITCTPTTCDIITVTQVGTPTDTFTFTVPTGTLTPAGTDGSTFFDLTGLAVTGPNGYSSSNDTVYFYPTSPAYTGPAGTGSYTGGLWDGALANNSSQPGSGAPGNFGFEVADATFFSGSVSHPTFNLTALTTNGPLVDYWSPTVTYNYGIAAFAATSPVPEPSSLLLLSTGITGLISACRRRRSA